MREKRGQLDISFGMIFSIIMIIAIVAVSFYVIQYFTKLSTCTQTGLFYDALQKEVDTSWSATSSRQAFSAKVPSKVDYICLGNMSSQVNPTDKKMFDDLYKIYRLSDVNIFVYPSNKGCQSLNSNKINHLSVNAFFCVKNEDGEVSLLLEKETFDTSVTASKI